jgi:hypothetical protein
MYAAVTAVFDVSSLLQSWKWGVEAYTAAGCRYSMVMVVSSTSLQLHYSLALLYYLGRSNISSSFIHVP